MAQKAYFGLDWIISLILAIIPPTSIILGFVHRLMSGSILWAILNLLLAPIFWIVDIVSMIVNKDIKWLI